MDQHEKEYQLTDNMIKKLIEKNIDVDKIKVHQLVEDGKEFHYWHGGQTVTIDYKGVQFSIEATGDIYFHLYDKSDGSEVFYVKDKANQGHLYSELSQYIKDDEDLELLLDGEHPVYESRIDFNNWWECFIVDGDDFYDLLWCLDGYSLTEAIEEVWDLMPEIYDSEILGIAI